MKHNYRSVELSLLFIRTRLSRNALLSLQQKKASMGTFANGNTGVNLASCYCENSWGDGTRRDRCNLCLCFLPGVERTRRGPPDIPTLIHRTCATFVYKRLFPCSAVCVWQLLQCLWTPALIEVLLLRSVTLGPKTHRQCVSSESVSPALCILLRLLCDRAHSAPVRLQHLREIPHAPGEHPDNNLYVWGE